MTCQRLRCLPGFPPGRAGGEHRSMFTPSLVVGRDGDRCPHGSDVGDRLQPHQTRAGLRRCVVVWVASSVDPPLQRVTMKLSGFIFLAAVTAASGVVRCRGPLHHRSSHRCCSGHRPLGNACRCRSSPSLGRFSSLRQSSSHCLISDYFRSRASNIGKV